MAETLKLAVPTMGKAGLNAQRSGHFGHCDCFTLVDIVNGELTNVSELDNPLMKKVVVLPLSIC